MPWRMKEPPNIARAIRDHGRVTLAPPDNAGRTRTPNANEKNSRRNEQEEGGSAGRTTQSSRAWDAAISSRRLFEDTSQYNIPSYPPPSFQEATASYPVSVASPANIMIGSTLHQPMLLSTGHDLSRAPESDSTEGELNRLSTTASYGSAIPATQGSPLSCGSDTSSLFSSSSLEITDTPPHTEQTISDERWPMYSSPQIPSNLTYSVFERDSEAEAHSVDTLPNAGYRHHHRLSLSPMRTFFPSHRRSSSATDDYIGSSTSTSTLLSRAASSPFFRSTVTLGSLKSESRRKRIFSIRTRERRGSIDEPMDSWEILDAPPETNDLFTSSGATAVVSIVTSNSRTSPQSSATQHPQPPPSLNYAPQSYCPVPLLQTHSIESPPIVTVRTRRFPPNPLSPPSHDTALETVLNDPLFSRFREYSSAEPETPATITPPSRHHYPGRPLPRPPGIDGAAAHLLTHPITPPACVTPPPPQYYRKAPTPASPQALVKDLIDFRESAILEVPVAGPQTSRENTDLLSDIFNELETTTTAESSCYTFIQGPIELERRRVTKDGRVKLKLSLPGFAVDKCGICISQFKKGEVGAKGRNCHTEHAFHGSCLQQWVATTREPRCPVCCGLLKV